MSEPTPDNPFAVLHDLASAAEALVNLLYLIEEERHDPDQVLHWVRMTDATVKKITSLTILA